MSRPAMIAIGLVEHGARPADGQPLFVVTRRLPDAHHLPGAWELPGGRIEEDETPLQALHRELAEELGVRVSNVNELTFSHHSYPGRDVLLLFFEAQVSEGEPRPLAASKLRLVTLAELLDIEFPEANAPLVRLLRRRLGV